jgi:hypothetical protein
MNNNSIETKGFGAIKVVLGMLVLGGALIYSNGGEPADCSYLGNAYSCSATLGAQPMCGFCPPDNGESRHGCNPTPHQVNDCCYELYCD